MVASSDSVLSMTAVPYSAGTPATASRGTIDAIGGVDRVHDQVGDRDVQRNTDHDDGGHAEVAQHRVQVGAAHRAHAVPPLQHQIRWLRA